MISAFLWADKSTTSQNRCENVIAENIWLPKIMRSPENTAQIQNRGRKRDRSKYMVTQHQRSRENPT